MPSYCIETCLRCGAQGIVLRASSASGEPTPEGTRVGFVRSTYVLEDEIRFSDKEGPA